MYLSPLWDQQVPCIEPLSKPTSLGVRPEYLPFIIEAIGGSPINRAG